MSEYIPPQIFRNCHLNTITASSAFRKIYAKQVSKQLRKESKSIVLELENNIRLQGFASTPKKSKSSEKPLVLMLHGWLGCADSVYLLPLAAALYGQGCSIFRLNFRDHGYTQHLNKGLFHSCRLDEILQATVAVQKLIPHREFFIIGHSLGGNFALRIGAHAAEKNIKIKKIYSICPVLNPENALKATKNMLKVYSEYYLRRWKQMLRIKHQYFPNQYDLVSINKQKNLNDMTEHLLLQHTEYSSLQEYLAGYSITGERLKTLAVTSEVFIAKDDPVIPANDHKNLYKSNKLNINLTQYGGHCGYMNGFFNMNWIDNKITNQLVMQKI